MNIRALLITVIGFILALLSGISLATENYEFFVWLPVIGLIMVSLSLQDKFWLIIPATAFVGGQLSFIPGQLNLHQLAILLAFVFFWVLLMFRRIQWHIRFALPEVLVCLFLIVCVQSYIRNPTGLNVLGSSSVGGKVYVHIIIGLLAYIVLAWIKVPTAHLKSARKLALVFGWSEFFVMLGARLSGGYFGAGASVYSSAAGQLKTYDNDIDTGAANREGFAVQGANVAGRQASSKGNILESIGLKIFYKPELRWSLLLALLAMSFAMICGFRIMVASTAMLLALGALYCGGAKSLLKGFALCFICYFGLVTINSVVSLPANVQRSLSFLPGNWEDRYVNDAKKSTEWRLEIWEEVLKSNRWIENKWLGDGPGFNSAQLSVSKGGRVAGFDDHRSSILINGDYHSGPISFIRCVGYVGLSIYLLITICLCLRAHKLMMRVNKFSTFPIYSFWLLPIISGPVGFIFFYGDFKVDAPMLFINLGFLALLERNFRAESDF